MFRNIVVSPTRSKWLLNNNKKTEMCSMFCYFSPVHNSVRDTSLHTNGCMVSVTMVITNFANTVLIHFLNLLIY